MIAFDDAYLSAPAHAWFVTLATARAFILRLSAYFIQIVRWPLGPIFTFATWRVMYAASGRSGVDGTTLSGFLVTGVFGSILLASSIWTSGSALEWERDEGTSASLFLSPASRSAVVAGYGLGSLIWFLPSFVAVVILGVVTGARLMISDPLVAVAAALSLTFASLAMGFLLAGLFILSRRGNLIANVMQPPLLLLSGFAVPVSALPGWVQPISNALPITAALQAFRQAVLEHGSWSTTGGRLLTSVLISLVYVVIGVFGLKWMEHVARGLGQLDLY